MRRVEAAMQRERLDASIGYSVGNRPALAAAWLHCETSFGVRQVQLHRAIRDQLGTQTTFRDGELGESIRFNQRVPPRFCRMSCQPPDRGLHPAFSS